MGQARNEEKFIGKCLDSIITQDYPKGKLEVLVVVSALRVGFSREGMKYVWVLPIVFFLYHISYGLGTWVGISKLAATLWKHDKSNGENVMGRDDL